VIIIGTSGSGRAARRCTQYPGRRRTHSVSGYRRAHVIIIGTIGGSHGVKEKEADRGGALLV
jgi:hypothetical protein